MAKGQQRDAKLEAFWRSAFERFNNTGMTVRAFCRREKVTEPAFYSWRREIRKRGSARGPAPAFVPLVLRDNAGREAEANITAELRGGRVLRLPATITGERLAELVLAVEAIPAFMEPRS